MLGSGSDGVPERLAVHAISSSGRGNWRALRDKIGDLG